MGLNQVRPQIFIDITGPLVLQVVTRNLLRSEDPVVRAVGVVLLVRSTATLVQAALLDIARALGLPTIA